MAITAFSFAAKQNPESYLVRFHLVHEYKCMGKLSDALRVGVGNRHNVRS